MTVQELKEAIYELVKRFSPSYKLRWANGKNTKVNPPCIVLHLKSVTMSTHPIVSVKDGALIKSHPSTAIFEINLYTPGKILPVTSGLVPYENTACDELAAFCHYLEYPHTENFQILHDISVLQQGTIIDVTSILDGIEPEYRAMIELSVDFVQNTEDPYAHAGNENGTATGYFETVEINEREN
jgi:hypothetical protein